MTGPGRQFIVARAGTTYFQHVEVMRDNNLYDFHVMTVHQGGEERESDVINNIRR